jgi:hypothetical protein
MVGSPGKPRALFSPRSSSLPWPLHRYGLCSRHRPSSSRSTRRRRAMRGPGRRGCSFRGRGPCDGLQRTLYPRSLDHLLAARWCRNSCSAQRCRTALLAVDQSRLRIASCSRRASRPMRTFSEAVLFVSPTPGPRTARARPAAHALYVFFRVVAVAVTVAQSRREETPLLPHPQPLRREAQLAGRLRDPVGG